MRLPVGGRLDVPDTTSVEASSPIGHRHFWTEPQTRRRFVRNAAGAAGVAIGWGMLSPSLARADDDDDEGEETHDPRPIPGGVQPFGAGTEVFHVFLPGAGAEPSTITDFKGFVGLAAVGGMGTGIDKATGKKTRLVFDADVRFMKGDFVGLDDEQHHGTFGFI